MYSLIGHRITVRGPRKSDQDYIENADTAAAVVVEGEDLGSSVLLIFDDDGKVIFRCPDTEEVALQHYESGARDLAQAVELEQLAEAGAG